MSLTYGFYNSANHDRKYNAIQMSSIFDGIIEDGIFMSIGDRFEVTAVGDDMFVNIGTGRCWFDHTWTLNDAPLPIEIPQSEVILNRYDAVVLEVNSEFSERKNTIKIVKGTPSSQPSYPALINTSTIHQYPLAYVYVEKNVTTIRQANITSMIGKEKTPYVTCPLDTINIESMVRQWEDQWKKFFEEETSDMTTTNLHWKTEWENWFNDYSNTSSEEFNKWAVSQKEIVLSWFEEMKDQLSTDAAINLQNQINTSARWFGFKLKVLSKEEYQRLLDSDLTDPLTFYWCPKNSEEVDNIYKALEDAYGKSIE